MFFLFTELVHRISITCCILVCNNFLPTFLDSELESVSDLSLSVVL